MRFLIHLNAHSNFCPDNKFLRLISACILRNIRIDFQDMVTAPEQKTISSDVVTFLVIFDLYFQYSSAIISMNGANICYLLLGFGNPEQSYIRVIL